MTITEDLKREVERLEIAESNTKKKISSINNELNSTKRDLANKTREMNNAISTIRQYGINSFSEIGRLMDCKYAAIGYASSSNIYEVDYNRFGVIKLSASFKIKAACYASGNNAYIFIRTSYRNGKLIGLYDRGPDYYINNLESKVGDNGIVTCERIVGMSGTYDFEKTKKVAGGCSVLHCIAVG